MQVTRNSGENSRSFFPKVGTRSRLNKSGFAAAQRVCGQLTARPEQAWISDRRTRERVCDRSVSLRMRRAYSVSEIMFRGPLGATMRSDTRLSLEGDGADSMGRLELVPLITVELAGDNLHQRKS